MLTMPAPLTKNTKTPAHCPTARILLQSPLYWYCGCLVIGSKCGATTFFPSGDNDLIWLLYFRKDLWMLFQLQWSEMFVCSAADPSLSQTLTHPFQNKEGLCATFQTCSGGLRSRGRGAERWEDPGVWGGWSPPFAPCLSRSHQEEASSPPSINQAASPFFFWCTGEEE